MKIETKGIATALAISVFAVSLHAAYASAQDLQEDDKDSGFSYISLYDPESAEYVRPPSYPPIDYFTMYKPDITKVQDAGIAPPVYPLPEKEEKE